jgi:hypothetical protein
MRALYFVNCIQGSDGGKIIIFFYQVINSNSNLTLLEESFGFIQRDRNFPKQISTLNYNLDDELLRCAVTQRKVYKSKMNISR